MQSGALGMSASTEKSQADVGSTTSVSERGLIGHLPRLDVRRVTRMPLYTAITEDGFVSDEMKGKIAKEITRIHATIMKVPASFVRVVFLSYPKASGYTAGKAAPTAALNCVLRSGHPDAEKTEMLKQLWLMFQDLTGIPTDQLAISLEEIPSSNAMEMGQIMQAVGHK
jgi:phenylpyruvate tautomerase PptA (4-oxalocrotonate tautomerase family)